MFHRNLLTLAVAASAALVVSACGGDDTTTTTTPKACTVAAEATDCTSSQVCHPVGLICVTKCTSVSDCASSNDLCQAVPNNADTETMCRCSSTSCASGQSCNLDVDDTCEAPCQTDADCTTAGFTGRCCNTTDHLCVISPNAACAAAKCTAATCTTAALPVCNATSGVCTECAADADCTNVAGGLTHCDTTTSTHTCVSPAATCNSSNLQPNTTTFGPDTCIYGDICSGSTCSATGLPAATCTAAASESWSATSSLHGPVIVSVNAQSFTGTGNTCNGATDVNCCANGGGGFAVDITFYAPNGMAAAGWTPESQEIQFISPTGTKTAAGLFSGFPSAGATYSTTLHAGICGSSGTAGVSSTGYAVYLVDSTGAGGNPACL